MSLAPSQLEALHVALLDAYRDRSSLKRMVFFKLGKNLDEINAEGDLEDTIFAVIMWADIEGKLRRLIEGAYQQNSLNKRVADIHSQLPAWFPDNGPTSDSEPDGRRSAEFIPPTPKPPQLSSVGLRPVIADLEIGLERGSDGYAVELRLALVDGEAEMRTKGDGLHLALDELRRLELDPLAYGRHLGEQLFRLAIVPQVFAMARPMEGTLRVRLYIDPSAEELNGVRWETLIDPGAPQPIAPLIMGERIQFSRYISSSDWRRVSARPRGELRALVVVANPSNFNEYRLSELDAPAEFAKARTALAGIAVVTCGENERASVSNIMEKLREDVDIFYLVCHGTQIEERYVVFLEDETGAVAVCPGDELAVRLRDLYHKPRMAILVSSMSAGSSASLGRMLCEAAVPAVLAMQGDVTVSTVHAFMPVFFRELQRDGQIDRAVAVARGAIRKRFDSWSPVLYMRLRSGQLWTH